MYGHMHETIKNTDIVIKTAAVTNYRPKEGHDEKMKKSTGDLHMEMERTKDILQSLGETKTNQYVVGFAAETSNHLENGRAKLQRKNLDAIVVNNVATEGAGFGGDTNIVTYINNKGDEKDILLAPKRTVAEKLLGFIAEDIKDDK